MIDLIDVSKSYGPGLPAVNHANLHIDKGEFVFVVGNSGSGKTTLIKLLMKELDSTSGQIIVSGERLEGMKHRRVAKYRRKLGVVFQDFRLLKDRNVYENVAFAQRVVNRPTRVIRKRVPEVLQEVGLAVKYKSFPDELSGGEQQRVALARALVVEPSVLLFDEPLSNLDAKLRVSMRTEIRNIQQRVGITAVYVTHDQSEAMALSDQIIIMNKGVVSQIGTPQEIYYHPADEFVADFIGEANFLRGRLVQKDGEKVVLSIDNHDVEVDDIGSFEVGSDCTVVLRPEAAVLAPEGQLPCKVVMSCFMGEYQNYHVMAGDTLVKITDFNPKHKRIYRVGEEAFVRFDTCDVHII